MTQFTDLPIELLPSIVGHLLRPQHLAQVCLVNKSLYHFAISQLYERVSIFAWHRDGKNKVIRNRITHGRSQPIALVRQAVKLLHTLAEYPHLACYVKRLGALLSIDPRDGLLTKDPFKNFASSQRVSLELVWTSCCRHAHRA